MVRSGDKKLLAGSTKPGRRLVDHWQHRKHTALEVIIAFGVAGRLVELHGTEFIDYFEFMEREVAELQSERDTIRRALAISRALSGIARPGKVGRPPEVSPARLEATLIKLRLEIEALGLNGVALLPALHILDEELAAMASASSEDR